MSTHTQTYAHTNTHIHRHTHTRTHAHILTHAHTHTDNKHSHPIKNTYTHTQTLAQTHVHKHERTHTRACVCACVREFERVFVNERVLECVLEDIRTNTHTKALTHNKLFNTRTYAHTNGPSVASQTNFPEYSNARAKVGWRREGRIRVG